MEAPVKRRFSLVGLALTLGALTLSVPLLAHHGNAAFDVGKRVTVTGTVTEWLWANPHCWLKVDVKDDKGTITHWVAETNNAPDMIERGWSMRTFKPGDEVTLTVEPVKNGRPAGKVLEVVLPNGQKLGMAYIKR
jgi:DNA/RNA endonuclease YhcR with UshA esterase domain